MHSRREPLLFCLEAAAARESRWCLGHLYVPLPACPALHLAPLGPQDMRMRLARAPRGFFVWEWVRVRAKAGTSLFFFLRVCCSDRSRYVFRKLPSPSGRRVSWSVSALVSSGTWTIAQPGNAWFDFAAPFFLSFMLCCFDFVMGSELVVCSLLQEPCTFEEGWEGKRSEREGGSKTWTASGSRSSQLRAQKKEEKKKERRCLTSCKCIATYCNGCWACAQKAGPARSSPPFSSQLDRTSWGEISSPIERAASSVFSSSSARRCNAVVVHCQRGERRRFHGRCSSMLSFFFPPVSKLDQDALSGTKSTALQSLKLIPPPDRPEMVSNSHARSGSFLEVELSCFR